MAQLGPSEHKVLMFLEKNHSRWCSPTEIGKEVGGGDRHSSWASPICLALVEKGYANRNVNGHYSVRIQ